MTRFTPLGWRPASMRARMTGAFALGIALVMGGASAGVYGATARAARRAADGLLQQSATELRGEALGLEHAPRPLPQLVHEEGVENASQDVALLLLDARGGIVARSRGRVPTWPPREGEWRTKTVSLQGFTLVMGVAWRKKAEELRELGAVLCGLTLLVTGAGALGAWAVVGRTLAPIAALSRQAQGASTALRVRLQAPSDDSEMRGLVGTLNDLLARLEESAAARGRFYAAASHELRTPLQALAGHLELALCRPRSEREYVAALGEARTNSLRLVSLAEDLLLLNQLEVRATQPPRDELDLCDIAERALQPLQPLMSARGLTLDFRAPAALPLCAPWNHAAMLCRNLLENAVKYAAPASRISVELAAAAGGATLQVFNPCAALPGWNAAKLFEPFYRPDVAREGETGGNGLGLAICKAICDANAWRISLEREPDGVRATVVFGDE